MLDSLVEIVIICFVCFVIISIVVVIVYINKNLSTGVYEDPSKEAGSHGEETATSIIRSVLREDDHLFTNVNVSYDGKRAEFDNVIENKYGVFIIEVKYYAGQLYGNEEDYEWRKLKTTDYGNTYEKTVKNPIKQVKRQVYILSKYLDYYGCEVWVEGKVIIIRGKLLLDSPYIIKDINQIDKIIHTFNRNRLNAKSVSKICELLS